MNDHIFCTPDEKLKGCEFGICSECPYFENDAECDLLENDYENYDEK